MAVTAPPDARRAALAVLEQVLHRRQALDLSLADDANNGGLNRLEPRDRAFARTLAATVLRRLGQIDRVLDLCVERPLPKNHHQIYGILRLGAAQLLFLGTPAHAAVDSTVALVPRRSERFRGLVNAVLRRLTRDGSSLIENDDPARLNTPDWLWASWTAAYGEATARAMAEVHSANPPLDLTVKSSANAEALAAAVDGQILLAGTVRRAGGGRITELPGYDQGDWWVQDVAAALPAQILLSGARALGLDPAQSTAIDLCAAPGGKTAQLAAAGATVTAVDRSAKRLQQLEQNLKRLDLSAETVAADGATWRPSKPAHLVLLDAPCTGTGTLRRHPDIAHLKSANDVTSLAATQTNLLRAAAAMVAPGGVLVYAVCSLQPEEGPGVIEAFLGGDTEFTRLPIGAEEVGGLIELTNAGGDVRSLPSHLAEHGGMDGFYAARLVKASGL